MKTKLLHSYAILIMAVLSVFAFSAKAESANYFKTGTSWFYHEEGTSGPFNGSSYMLASLGDEVEIAGKKAGTLWEENVAGAHDRQLITYLSSEGEKVYFLCDETTSDWRLLYDFGMEEGDTETLWWFNGSILYGNVEPVSRFVKCTSISVMPDNPRMTEMRFDVYSSETDYLSNPDSSSGKCTWLAGIGNIWGPLYNVFGEGIDGGISTLLEVTSDDSSIYRDPDYAGAHQISNDSELRIETAESMIRVISQSKDIQVYTSDGIQCNGSDGIYTGLSKGLHVVKTGGRSAVVMVP